jgi:hypothetical protein
MRWTVNHGYSVPWFHEEGYNKISKVQEENWRPMIIYPGTIRAVMRGVKAQGEAQGGDWGDARCAPPEACLQRTC